jgi:hypothetical protein
MMKNKEFSLQGEEKTLFLENLFVVMRIASENKSTAAQGIALKLAARQMKNEIPGFQVADYVFSFKKELDPETKQSIYVVEAASNKDKNVVVTRRYDSFFMPLN